MPSLCPAHCPTSQHSMAAPGPAPHHASPPLILLHCPECMLPAAVSPGHVLLPRLWGLGWGLGLGLGQGQPLATECRKLGMGP